MPTPHYQRVLEQDAQLPAPLRWLTRAASSWWTIGLLGTLVVGYVLAALVPIGGRYVWQWRALDTTQHAMLTWWPLMTGAWLLAAAVLWSAMRRRPMHWDCLGRYICVLGLAMILALQSWSFRHQTTGVVAVAAAEIDGGTQTDPLSLTYTTRFGDTTDRELVIMVAGVQPVPITLDGLPRWHDAAGDALPAMRLHDDPRLSSTLGFKVRITPTAYVADGSLDEQPDGKQTATPMPSEQRNYTALPYPGNALLAIEFEVDPDEGEPATTIVWVPFDPSATDSLVPRRFYNVQGLGSVGLSFRPTSRKLPFAVAGATPSGSDLNKFAELTLYAADADPEGRLLEPGILQFTSLDLKSRTYDSINEAGRVVSFDLDWLNPMWESDRALIGLTSRPVELFITAALIAFVLGVAVDFLMGWLVPSSKTQQPKNEAAQ